jgi:alpha-galactosidase
MPALHRKIQRLFATIQLRSFVMMSVFAFLAFGAVACWGKGPSLTSRELWKPEHVPFSFRYDGQESERLLPAWQISREQMANGTVRYSYVDSKTKLKVIADVRYFRDYPGAVDWVISLRNEGSSDTPIIEDILPLHWAIAASPGDCVIRHARGSDATAQDFEPLDEHFGPSASDHLDSPGGDPSSRNTLPFFNLQTGDHGLVGAIGWTGGWKADFAYAADGKTIAMTAGVKRTHLVLHPGEEIRTPRIVLMDWSGGNWGDAQNLWRRLLLAHYSPHDNGKPMIGPILFGSWGSEEIDQKIAYIQWVHDHNIPVELYAVDAGWYGDSFGAETDPTNPWWKNRGDWFPSPRYYPHGIRPLGEALKAAGFGFSLWIEPETSMYNRKIIEEHPDWYLHSDRPVDLGVALANLGTPAVLKGITDMVSSFIADFEMTWYRQDFNIPPDRYWELADPPDRIGMTEIGHVEGLYKMWDDLLARHPGLHIDNCASGGRRIDIEMMSRSFVVWRTDHGFLDTLAEQAQTQALAPWVPENMAFESYTQSKPWKKFGPYSNPETLYLMRLGYDAGYGTNPGDRGVDNPEWVTWIRQAIGEYNEVRPYFYGDFYPLQPYSLDADVWTVWQWDRPESKDGVVIVLRRPKSAAVQMELDLQHLKLNKSYHVEIRRTYERAPIKEMKGNELAHLQIHLTDAPGSVVVFYRQK